MDRVTALLSVQRALLASITPTMRAVAIAYVGEPKVRVYFEHEPSAFERELLDGIAGEMLADFPDVADIVGEAVVSGAPARDLDPLDAFVYFRHEQEAV